MLEMITTCVNYGDYLAVTLPYNINVCSKIYVITSKNDLLTQDICRAMGNKVECIISDVFFEKGAIFNKGKAINLALDAAEKKNWLLICDADIILPYNLNLFLPKLQILDAIYSSKREFCTEKKYLNNILNEVNQINSNNIINHPKPWMSCLTWPTVGYFQLFHSYSNFFTQKPKYREDFKTAAGCDLQFARQWPKEKSLNVRARCIHLGQNRKNWNGRTTTFF